jgi:hypothetical protein
MIRTYLSNDYIKRTIRPLYSWTQATPKACFLDPNWQRGVPIWPGMGFVRTGGDLVTLSGATTAQMNNATMNATVIGQPVYGLGALYVGGDGIDELLYAGINTFAVWVLGPDAEFEILAPAFDATATWVDPTDGTGAALVAVSITGANQGMLVPYVAASTSAPCARLLKINSSTKLTIGGLAPFTSGTTGELAFASAPAGRD